MISRTAVSRALKWAIAGGCALGLAAPMAWSQLLGGGEDDDNPLAALLNSAVDVDSQFSEINRETLLEAGEFEIGVLLDVQGDVERLYNFQPYTFAEPGDTVFTNEIISTFADSLALIEFADGTTISLGANSEVMLDSFIYDPETKAGALGVNMLSGVTKFVSGDMSAESYQIETPIGMAAIRGTELVFFVEPDGEMQLAVFSGAVDFSLFTPEPEPEPEAEVEVGSEAGSENEATTTADEPATDDPAPADPAPDQPASTTPEQPATTTFTLTGRAIEGDEAEALSNDFLSFRVDDGGGLAGQDGAMLESFTAVNVVFEDPTAYSSFVGAFKTEQYEQDILDACLTGADCEGQLEGLVEELGELGVEKEDALTSLQVIESELTGSGAELTTLRTALSTVKAVTEAVKETYTPQTKGIDPTATPEPTEEESAQASVESLDAEQNLLQSGEEGGEGTVTEGDGTATELSITDGGEGDGQITEAAVTDQPLGTVLTPGSSFTVFSKPSRLRTLSSTALQASNLPATGNGRTKFGVTFRVIYPYYATVSNLSSEALIGSTTAEWIGLPSGTEVMSADVGLRANGGFRMQLSFPALATASQGCGPVVVSSINGTSSFYQVPGRLIVSLGEEAAFELDAQGTISENSVVSLPFELVEFRCEARPDGLYTGLIALELVEHKTYDMTVQLDILTAGSGPTCGGGGEEPQSFLCTNPNLSLQLQPIALELSPSDQ